ncbi:MAG: hypothetical protein KAU90_03315, partial [Sulfurovaceae bacterium]|nr:hypothetical protein [Sulfurovaceae bacterium]
DKKTLTVDGEGVWTLDDQGLLTFTPEDNFDGVPTDISYLVKSTSGIKSQTATVALSATAVEGVKVEVACQTEDNIPAMGEVGILITLILGGLLALFFRRKEEI